MSNLYYNISLPSGGTGTTSDPYGLDNWITNVSTISSNIAYTKGSAEVDQEILIGKTTISGWYSDQSNGIDKPWRIKFGSGIVVEIYNDAIISDGIIKTQADNITIDNGSIISNCCLITDPVYYIWDEEYQEYSEFNGDITINSVCYTPVTLKGCTLIGNNLAIISQIGTELGADSSNFEVFLQDCTINCSGISMSHTNLPFPPTYPLILTLNQCSTFASSVTLPFEGGSNGTRTILDEYCQYGWSGPSWPEWDSEKTLWTYDVLLVDVSGSIKSGNPPYSGYSVDLFNSPRCSIGAVYCQNYVEPSPAPEIHQSMSSKVPGFYYQLTQSASSIREISKIYKKNNYLKGKIWIY